MPSGVSLTRLGYDTRSWRSAIVMRAIDALNPFKRELEIRLGGSMRYLIDRGVGRLVHSSPADWRSRE